MAFKPAPCSAAVAVPDAVAVVATETEEGMLDVIDMEDIEDVEAIEEDEEPAPGTAFVEADAMAVSPGPSCRCCRWRTLPIVSPQSLHLRTRLHSSEYLIHFEITGIAA